MSVLLRNTETNETIIVHEVTGSLKPPWKVERNIPILRQSREEQQRRQAELNAKLAVYAASLGLPVGKFLDAARWLLKKECPYCQLGTQVLRRIEQLGKDKAIEMISRILMAKNNNDLFALEKLKQEFKNLA